MARIFLVNTSRICLILATLATLASLGGGGLVLPPFKSLSWFKTSSSNVGLYGACLSGNLSVDFFTLDESWGGLQESECANMFTAPKPEPVGLSGRLSPRDEIMACAVTGFALILALTALITSRIARPQALTTLAFAAFVMQAFAAGLCVYQFKMVEGVFGPGMYVGGGAAVLFLVAGGLGWSAIKSEDEKEYTRFRDSQRRQDTYY